VRLRSHKYAILLVAIVGVALVESFSHRLLLGPLASDLAVSTAELLVLLIVFDRRVNRLVAFIAFATAVASASAHYVLPPTYPQVPLRLIYHSALLLLLGYATIVILRNISSTSSVPTTCWARCAAISSRPGRGPISSC
jgi:hypothetical protein